MAYSQDSNLEMEPGQMKGKIIVRDFSAIAGKQAEAGVDRLSQIANLRTQLQAFPLGDPNCLHVVMP